MMTTLKSRQPTSAQLISAPLLCGFAALVFHVSSLAIADPAPVSIQAGLGAAIQATLNNHPAIQGKLAEVASKGYAADNARSRRFPNLSVQASVQDDDQKPGTVLIQQPLWAFGKIDIPIELADVDVLAERSSLLQLQRELLEDTAATYATIEGIQLRKSVAMNNTEELHQLYEHVQRRQKGQLASEVDVRLAFSRLTQARARHQKIEGELQVTLSELESLTQVPVNTSIPVDQSLVQLPGLTQIEARALENSAEVLYKQKLVQLSRLEVDRERVSDMPTLFLNVERDILDARETSEDETRVAVVLEGSVEGLGFGGSSRVKQASSQLIAAKQDLKVTENDIKQRIKSLMTNRSVQLSLSQAQEASVSALDETLSSYMRQYESGRKSWLEVLNIQRELTEQRIQLAQTQSDWLVISLRIAAIAGMLDPISGIGTQNNNDY